MQNEDTGQRYRRTMDREYVTRHEWLMHLAEGQRAWDGLQKHLEKQDGEIDKLQSTVSRAVGGATVVILVGQALLAFLISR